MCFKKFTYELYLRLYYLGDSSEGGTPDPIPNSVVKSFSSDDTQFTGKSRSSPR